MRWLPVLIVVACAKKPAAVMAPSPPPPTVVDAPRHGGPWAHDLYAEHELVGRIWRAEDGAFVSEEQLVEALRAADWRLLGEKHDNADHHRLQGRMIAALSPTGVAFEQIDDGDVVGDPQTATEVAQAVAWDESGWPEFSLYEPVFASTLAAGAQVLPGHPTREQLMGTAREGLDSLGSEADGLRMDRALDDDQRASLEAEIVEAHCGHADGHMVQMMVGMQRLKDAWMARALTRHGVGAVLVAGNGHTRSDRGVPHYLDGSVVSLGFVEVADGDLEPSAYEPPADYLWFTPRLEDVDPCEKFRESLEKMGHGE